MMKNYSKNILADSLSGAIFAIEGIKDGFVILNGPTGCKFYHSAISDSQYIRSLPFLPTQFAEDFYFGQPRVPCTYLDGDDYVYGSSEKLEKILDQLKDSEYKFIAIINSPGSALIGDDLKGFLDKKLDNVPCIAIENTGYSTTFSDGYENAILKVLDEVKYIDKKYSKKTVNLIGINLYQKYFLENNNEIKNILKDYDIEVITSFTCGDTFESISSSKNADLNIVLYPEYGSRIAEKMQEQLDIPYIILKEGPPIGYLSTESMVREICSFFNIEYIASEYIEKSRGKSYIYISRFASLTGLPKGGLYSIKAEASVTYAFVKFLSKYLGMNPVAIEITEDSDIRFKEKLEKFLEKIDAKDALLRNIIEEDTDLLFADGNTIAQKKLYGSKFSAIEISMPSLGYIDVLDKSLVGAKGSLYLIEQILNGLRYLM